MSETGVSDGKQQVLIPGWKVLMFQLFTVLNYANSAVNPLLYVFVNENFRQNCWSAIRCRSLSPQLPTTQQLRSARQPVAPVPQSGIVIELQTNEPQVHAPLLADNQRTGVSK